MTAAALLADTCPAPAMALMLADDNDPAETSPAPMMTCESSSSGGTAPAPAPLAKDAIHAIQKDVEGSDKNRNDKRGWQSGGGGGGPDGEVTGGETRPAKRMASVGKQPAKDEVTVVKVKDTFGIVNTDALSTGYLPPRGTIFQIIPKQQSDRRPSSTLTSTLTTDAREHQPFESPRTVINNAIVHLINSSLSGATGALRVHILTLMAPNLAIVEFLNPVTGDAYTTATATASPPNVVSSSGSSCIYPLSGIIKSYPRHPKIKQSQYKYELIAYQAMADAVTNPTSDPPCLRPAGLPAFFGAWDYASVTSRPATTTSPTTTDPLFPVLLLENLRATPLRGVTLAEWLDSASPHGARAREATDMLSMLPRMRDSAVNTLQWVHQKCNTAHRGLSLSRGKLVVLQPEQEAGVAEVVIVGWGGAATGEVVEGGRDSEDEGLPERRLQAVKTWGRSDVGSLGSIFERSRMKLVGIVEDAEDEDEDEDEEEDENENGEKQGDEEEQ